MSYRGAAGVAEAGAAHAHPDSPAVRQAIVVSDLHCGCKLGLCPPYKIQLDEGGYYEASDLQKKVWEIWQKEFWSEWVPVVTRGEPFAVVINSDATDGVHHGATTQISHNLSDQRRIAKLVLEPVVEASRGRFYMIRGTEAHVGPSGMSEEALAEGLGAIPNETGNYARWDMWARIGSHLSHITHHIGVTGSMHYETTALMKEFAEACGEAGRYRLEAPAVVVRAHRHRFAEIKVPTGAGDGICVVTPGWQLRTPYVWRGSGRNTTPQFGGILVRSGNEEVFTRHYIKTVERTPEVRL